jgi:hypothetical protein
LNRGHRDALRHFDVFGRHSELLQELNLDVSTQELLSVERAFTYADLYVVLGNRNTVAWLTPNAFVVLANGRGEKCSFYLQDDYRFRFNVDGKDIQALARCSEAYSEIANVVLRLLASSVLHSVILDSWYPLDGALINAASVANLMEQCHSLKVLTLKKIYLDGDNIRVLGDYSNPGLENKLDQCQITGTAATVLAQVLRSNQGPTKLDYCYINNFALVDGLCGNSRLKSLTLCFSTSSVDGNKELLAIAGGLKENTGLAHLDLRYGFRLSDEMWDAVYDSLKTHPTLKVLILPSMNPVVIKSRIQTLVGMLRMNKSIHTIHHYCDYYNQDKLFRGTIIPYLVTNRLRPRLLAIQKICPTAYRAKVLGRALVAARKDVNRFWMLLSGNAEVAFLSMTTATTTPAASLPTPATAAATHAYNVTDIAVTAAVAVSATSNAAAVAVTAAVAVAATRTASTTAASVATNVATPTSCCTIL